MNEENKVCPKCIGDMVEGKLWGYFGIRLSEKKGSIGVFGDGIRAFYCKNCGYIELYKEKESLKSAV